MVLRGLALVLILGFIGAGLYLASPAGRQLLDRVSINAKREENTLRHQSGLPLRGSPDLARLDERLASKGVRLGDKLFIRIFKLESELELWVEKDGRYELFATYPICRWSGRLGPKLKEGDRQAPEGFYTVGADQLNPDSRWHRSFNLGFPNALDRAHGRTGSFLMVHGGCGSVGCYAMTNAGVDEIWRFVTSALDKTEAHIPVHVFPFRMTDRKLDARATAYSWGSFWEDLKKGYDLFEASRIPPAVSVCNGRYQVAPGTLGDVGKPIEENCAPSLAGNS